MAFKIRAIHTGGGGQPLALPGIWFRVFDGWHFGRRVRPVQRPVFDGCLYRRAAGTEANNDFLNVARLTPLQTIDVTPIGCPACVAVQLVARRVVEGNLGNQVVVGDTASSRERSDVQILRLTQCEATQERGPNPSCGDKEKMSPKEVHEFLDSFGFR